MAIVRGGAHGAKEDAMPGWLQAALWGWLAGSALLLGAWAGDAWRIPQRVVAGVMAFGAGVLIATLSFELMDEAFRRGGLGATAVGFLGGAAAYTALNLALDALGARHRKRSGAHPHAVQSGDGGGLAIAAGALLDGIPESIVIGVGLLEGGRVGLVTVVAVFLSNLPEGLSSAAGMRRAGRSRRYVFGVWGAIALATGLAALAGYTLFDGSAPETIAMVTAVAAGAVLAMVVDTMIPEAFAETHAFAGLISVAGFLVAFALGRAA